MAWKLTGVALFICRRLEGSLHGYKSGSKLPDVGVSEKVRLVVDVLELIAQVLDSVI